MYHSSAPSSTTSTNLSNVRGIIHSITHFISVHLPVALSFGIIRPKVPTHPISFNPVVDLLSDLPCTIATALSLPSIRGQARRASV